MKKCPNCSYQFSTSENLILVFKSKLCPQCKTFIAHEIKKSASLHFLVIILYAILLGFSLYYGYIIEIEESLQFKARLMVALSPVIFQILLWVTDLILTFFYGDLVQASPSKSFRERLKEMVTYDDLIYTSKGKLTILSTVALCITSTILVIWFLFLSISLLFI